jgi:enterochelin esterase-like enzyme
MKSFLYYGCFILFYLATINVVKAQNGHLVVDTVYGISLEGNLLGDSPHRSVYVYLPPDYNSALEKRYPVLYLLHGNYSHNTVWTLGAYQGMNIKSSMDSLTNEGLVREMILVMPDGYNRYRGCHFVNSSVAGKWADFITFDLVKYIDTKHRTLPSPQSRGLAGHSMGGRATLYLGMTHPDIYCAIYGLSSGDMYFDEILAPPEDPGMWSQLLRLKDVNQVKGFKMIRILGLSAAFSPNPNRPPFYVDHIYELSDGTIQPVPEVWKKWHDYDPVTLVSSLQDNLNQLKAIRFDCGKSDYLLGDSHAFANALKTLKIPYVFEEYEGNHVNRIRERIETEVLPFFSEVLEFDPPSK